MNSNTAAGDAKSGMTTCQALCHNHMCCVEQEEEYSCKNDVTRACAVYAGCVALIYSSVFTDDRASAHQGCDAEK